MWTLRGCCQNDFMPSSEPRSIALFGKPRDEFTDRAIALLQERADRVDVFQGLRTDPFPLHESNGVWDAVISYRSPWIIPAWLLARARLAVNFHPAPPEYPGIGCTNFALYEGATEYGVTAHHMAPAVDTGSIIAVRRFPVQADDTVHTLTIRAYEVMFELFVELLDGLLGLVPLPKSAEQWTRRPFTREQLDALCVITPDMDAAEVTKRVRATTFPNMPGAYIMIGGQKFLSDASVFSRTPVC